MLALEQQFYLPDTTFCIPTEVLAPAWKCVVRFSTKTWFGSQTRYAESETRGHTAIGAQKGNGTYLPLEVIRRPRRDRCAAPTLAAS